MKTTSLWGLTESIKELNGPVSFVQSQCSVDTGFYSIDCRPGDKKDKKNVKGGPWPNAFYTAGP